MLKNKLLKPFVKWAGGKRQLLPEIKKYVPARYSTYFEPFLGGGAVLFELQPKKFIVNDTNSEIINVYQTIRTNVEELINELNTYRNEQDFYYQIRGIDRTPDYNNLTGLQKAARILYLNKTCFNGLFRVNSQGQFNVPFGNYKNPDIVNEITLKAVSKYLNDINGTFLNVDFEAAVQSARRGSFIYFDPPYDPVSDSSSFTGYTINGFNRDEQERLRNVCNILNNRGCRFLLSNSSTEFIHDLYAGYRVEIVKANRNINADGEGRGEIDEVLIRNYE